MTAPVALVARARGRATHLASDAALAAIERAGDRAAVRAALAAAGWTVAPGDDVAVALALDDATAARAADELARLARWADGDALALVIADEDRRSLRGVIRGLTAAASATARLRGAVPTPSLPRALLATLATCAAGPAVHAALVHAAHPAAEALAAPLAAQPLELIAVEHALVAWVATRLGDARDPALAEHAAQLVDAGNAGAALALAGRGRELDPATAFVAGGRRLARAAFEAAAAASPTTCAAALAAAFAATPLAAPLASGDAGAVERAALAWHVATQARWRRVEPLGLGPVLWLWLRRRSEHARVRHAAWRVAMGGAP